MKRLFLLLLCLALILSTSSVAFAKVDNNMVDTVTRDKILLDNLSKEYNLKDVDKVPEGIVPIKFNSIDELKAFLEKQPKGPVKIHKTYYANDFLIDKNNINDMNSNVILESTGKHHINTSETINIGGFVSLDADVFTQVRSLGSTHLEEIITDCKEWTSLTGVTLGAEWDERYAYHVISSDRYRVDVYGGGVLNEYLIVDGLIKIASYPIDLSVSYYGGIIN